MGNMIYLYTYEGRGERRLSMEREAICEPQRINIVGMEIVGCRLPFSRAYLEEVQKSFRKRKLFFLWLSICSAFRKQKELTREIKTMMQQGRIGELCEIDAKYYRKYAKAYLLVQYDWARTEKWAILCSPQFDGAMVSDFITACKPKVKEIILVGSRLFDPELMTYQEETGILISKTDECEMIQDCRLILDGSEGGSSLLRYVPDVCTFIDLSQDVMKRRRIMRKSAQIQYISLGKFLDRHFRFGL